VAWWPFAGVAAVTVLAAAGVIVFVQGDWTRGLNDAVGLRDPEPVTPAAIANGRALYRVHCIACHGARGRGDGPSGVGLDPPPADLVLHVPQHTDGELFYMISRGMPNSAMPAWRPLLTDRERWDIVHYLSELGAGAP
jgi:mono/diheme cytochrome c family protein